MLIQTAFQKLFRIRENAARRRPGADDGFDAHEKPFLDHLDDLRQTLMKVIATLLVSTIVCFAFHKQIFQLVQYPAESRFAEIAPGVTLKDKLDLITLGPTEFIFLTFKLAFYSGLIVTFPFTVFFLFQFLMPGLRQAEKRAIIPGVGIGFVLFLIGGSFAFFLAIPMSLKYFYEFENERIATVDPVLEANGKPITELGLVGFDGERIAPVKDAKKAAPEAADAKSADAAPGELLTPEMKKEIRAYLMHTLTTAEGANFALRYDETRDKLVLVGAKGSKSSYQVGKYISFITQLVLVFGVSFQMPIVVTILVKLDLLTARVMRTTRSYAWVLIMVLAAILTPSPDAFTMCLLGVPLILLYEVCIIVATIIERRREKRERAEEEAERTRLEQLYMRPASELTEEEKEELHRAEIEQYEKEHAHLYLEESDHVSRDSLHGDDGHEGDAQGDVHDESWEGDVETGLDSDHAEPEDLRPEEPAHSEDYHYDNCAPEGPIVDLNHASLEELQTLPGIGPKLAEAIVECRHYETFADLDRVPGLGPEKIQRITERVMLG